MTETPTNVTTPPDLTYGYVDGRIILAIGDRSDAGRMPDPVPADGMTVTFTPANTILKVTTPTPATVIKQRIVCSVDANGYLIDGQAARGVWLVTGTYKVTYSHPRAMIPSHDIEVTTGHTEAAPLDLTTAMPPGGPVLAPSEYAELNGRLTILEAGGPEIVRDVIGAAMVAGSGIQITVNDAGDSITIASTAVLPTRQVIAGTGLTGGGDLSADRTLTVAYGTAAGTAAQGNDSRLTDDRAPTAHTHPLADVTDAGTAAAADVGDFATAAQGVLAGTASQPGHAHAGADITSGTVAYARLPVGTAASTLAAGDDSRITGAAQKSANLSDLASASTARTNLGLTDAAVVGALPIPDPGSFYPTDTIAAALQLIGGRERYGTGSPEGVVTAAVGTYYNDTAGTLGAWRWQKRTGAGNTGWVCTSGDTGARNISTSISGTYYSGGSQARLSRVNGTIFLTMDVATIAGYTTTAVLTLPAGFAGIPSYISPGYAGTTWFGTAGTSISLNFSGANAGLRGTWSWRATDAWPTSLPGTAA